MVDLMFEMNRELGTALVLITHDPALAERAERVVRLRNGRIVENSKTGGLAPEPLPR